MINEFNVRLFCCEDISLIENYDKAIADKTQVWHCHHRNGIELKMSEQQLKDANMYYKRPACELLFLTEEQHKQLHSKYRDLSFWTCKGKKRSLQNRKNISNGIRATMTKEIAYKHGNGTRQTRWWNNGKINVRRFECPKGFVAGRLKYN